MYMYVSKKETCLFKEKEGKIYKFLHLANYRQIETENWNNNQIKNWNCFVKNKDLISNIRRTNQPSKLFNELHYKYEIYPQSESF